MTSVTEGLLTFDEFLRVGGNRYELVDGRLEQRPAHNLQHGWTVGALCAELQRYLHAHEPGFFAALSLAVPLRKHHARCLDYCYYSAEDAAAKLDLQTDRVLGVPTLAVEVTSPGFEDRDCVVKRQEYGDAGIPHYWIVDPTRKTVVTLALEGSVYEVTGVFAGDAVVV